MRVAACGLSSGRLVVRYQGDALGIFIINLVPASLGSNACAVTILHGEGGLSFYRATQRYMSDYYVYPLMSQDPDPRLHSCFLIAPFLFLHSLL